MDIPINKTHECSSFCKKTFIECKPGCYQIGPNPDYDEKTGRCKDYGKVSEGCIHISDYLPGQNEEGFHDLDKIVVTDSEMDMVFDYPLNGEHVFHFKAPQDAGFTRKDLINSVCQTYHKIYDDEEETAKEQHFHFKKKCNSCGYELLVTDEVVDEPVDDVCAICHYEYRKDDDVKKLPCNHIYHSNCVSNWLEEHHSCPLCRKECGHIIQCGKCDGGEVVVDYIGKVLPVEERAKLGGLINRHRTDGVYGIWGHDIGDLWIEGLTYDKDEQKLYLTIGS